MTSNNKDAASLIKQPFVIAIALVVVAIVLIWATQKPAANSEQGAPAETTAAQDAGPGEIKLKPPAISGQNTPKIVQNMSGNQQKAGSVSAPGLESLVKGLEEKVKANPTVNNRLLLAQTYNELGMQDKALAGIRELQKEEPENGRVNLILSSILSRSTEEAKLKESLSILDKLSGDETVQQYLVNMYKGDALIRIQDHDGALKYWKLALEDMPAADNRRTILEKRIADLSMKSDVPADSASNS